MMKGHFVKGNFRVDIERVDNYTKGCITDLYNKETIWELEGTDHKGVVQVLDGLLEDLN